MFHGHIVPTCDEELVNGPFPIPDSQITASSEWANDHGPHKARLHNNVPPAAWCPSDDEKCAPTPRMYIQVSKTLVPTPNMYI